MTDWNPAVAGPQIDPHNTPYTKGAIEPVPPAYGGVNTSWNPSDPHGDPHDTPLSPGDGLGGGMVTGETPPNIVGGALSDGRTANVR